jgi:hypothetical protein
MAHAEIKNPGPFQVSGSTTGIFLFLSILGVVTFAGGLMTDPHRTWATFLHNHWYFLCLGLGGIFFASIQWLTGAMWSAPVRRVSESFTAYLPFAVLTTAALYFGMNHIFVWMDPAYVRGDVVLEGKSGYLNSTFFMIRNLIAVSAWLYLARRMVGNSIAQDSDGLAIHTIRNRRLAPAFLAIFGVTFTMAAFDQLMSLDPHWFSTMLGVYAFAGLFYANLALTCLVSIYLKDKGKLEGIVNANHLHDLGKFMFAFTVFWAYIGFCQFMLIWYANLPEETGYYLHRFANQWFYVSIFLLLGKFMVPFFVLIPRGSKRNPRTLTIAGVFMLVAQWIDVLWLVQPEFFREGPRFGWIEAGTTAGFVGVFFLLVSRFWAKHSVVAIRDPKLAESVYHHHQ